MGKLNKKNPREIAEKIKKILIQNIHDFSEVEIAGPGFLNIKLTKEAWIKNINIFFKSKNKFGSNKKRKK